MLAEQSQLIGIDFEDFRQQKAVLLLTCPVNGKTVKANEWKHVLLNTKTAMWWQCQECKGWHITLPKENR